MGLRRCGSRGKVPDVFGQKMVRILAGSLAVVVEVLRVSFPSMLHP